MSSNGHKLEVGNETVLFRHRSSSTSRVSSLRVSDDLPLDDIKTKVAEVDGYVVDYVGMP